MLDHIARTTESSLPSDFSRARRGRLSFLAGVAGIGRAGDGLGGWNAVSAPLIAEIQGNSGFIFLP